MAATSTSELSTLLRRQFYGGYGCEYYGNCNSSWYNWGRWVLLGCIIVAAFLLFLGCSCLNARRRRRRGTQPLYGTGWLAGKTPDGHNQPSYNGGYVNNNNNYAAAPPYQPPQTTGNTFNSNEGYYGQPNGGGYEMQPPREPQQAYAPARAGEQVYDAPVGPPPAKK